MAMLSRFLLFSVVFEPDLSKGKALTASVYLVNHWKTVLQLQEEFSFSSQAFAKSSIMMPRRPSLGPDSRLLTKFASSSESRPAVRKWRSHLDTSWAFSVVSSHFEEKSSTSSTQIQMISRSRNSLVRRGAIALWSSHRSEAGSKVARWRCQLFAA